jgi:cell wall-associated NlpC family hydrolase
LADGLASIGVRVGRTITAQVESAPFRKDVQGKDLGEVIGQMRRGDMLAFDWDPEGGKAYNHGAYFDGEQFIHASGLSSYGKVVRVDPSYFGTGWKTIYSYVRG